MICLYKVTPSGGMKRIDEVPIKMGRNFVPTSKGNMVLVRSYDKRLISLVNYDKSDIEGNYFNVKAWTTKLEPWSIAGNDE